MLLRLPHMIMTILLLVSGFYTPNLDVWERHCQNFLPVSNLFQINPSLWKIPLSGRKGRHAPFLVA